MVFFNAKKNRCFSTPPALGNGKGRLGEQKRPLFPPLPFAYPIPFQRLRTAVLSLARVQRNMPRLPHHLPLAIVERILCSAMDDA